MNISFINRILNQIGKRIVKPTTHIPTDTARLNSLLDETTGVTGKFLHPKITQKTLNKALKASDGYIRYSNLKTGFEGGIPLGKIIDPTYVPKGSVSIPLRSKNPDIDLVAKEMLDSRNDMKNFIQSKFYRKLLRKNRINEKEAIQGSEDALDIASNYVSHNPTISSYGTSNSGYVVLNGANPADTRTYLHELTHESAQLGTPKRLFVDYSDISGSLQNNIYQLNQNLFNKVAAKEKINKAFPYTNPEYVRWKEYFSNPVELQANLRPVQMLMVERGWQPKQVYRLLESRSLLDKMNDGLGTDTLIRALGEKGLAKVLANMLKKGGKIKKNKWKPK